MKKFILSIFIIIFCTGFVFASDKGNNYSNLINNACEYAYNDEYDKSLEEINKAIKLNPKSHSAYFTRAGLYLLKGNYKAAIKDYNMVEKLSPSEVQEAGFFKEMAQTALDNNGTYNFHKYNIILQLGEGKVIPESNEKKELMAKIVYLNKIINAYNESIRDFCSQSGYIPKKYFSLHNKTFKNTNSNLNKLINQLKEEEQVLVKAYYDYDLDNFMKVHINDLDDIQTETKKQNINFTKANYCEFFDADANDIIDNAIKTIKEEVPDLYKK